jgi:flagellar basal-body rod protein FlgG
MDPGLRTAATGMMAQQLRVEVIAHNLANVNTPAFKRSRAHFEDLLYQTVQGASTLGQPGTGSAPAIQIGRGTRLAAVQRIESQGPLEPTNRPLDLAIEGDGYFQVRRLVTSAGYTLVPEISIPHDASQFAVSGTGVVTVAVPGQPEAVEIGRIEIVRFANAPGLLSLGQNLHAETSASGSPEVGMAQEDGFGRIMQGALEASNVEIVQEMIDMIAALRAYEINSKAVQTSEQMATATNQMVR